MVSKYTKHSVDGVLHRRGQKKGRERTPVNPAERAARIIEHEIPLLIINRGLRGEALETAIEKLVTRMSKGMGGKDKASAHAKTVVENISGGAEALAQKQPPQETPASTGRDLTVPKPAVLVVLDSMETRADLNKFFSQTRFDLVFATNAQDAYLMFLQSTPPVCAMILGESIPWVSNGEKDPEAINRLLWDVRIIDDTTPIVFLGSASEDVRRAARNAGVNECCDTDHAPGLPAMIERLTSKPGRNESLLP